MLYKQNLSKTLSNELFKEPTKEYRGTPFWAWNCKMTKEILEKQITYLKKMGFGGFHMHSRAGMDNAYLGKEFMDMVKVCVKKAKKEDMLAWLYDEDKWPSGFAGGLVTKEPRYRARGLWFVPAKFVKLRDEFSYDEVSDGEVVADFSNELPKAEAIEEGAPYFVAAYDVELDGEGYLAKYKKIKRNESASGEKWYAFCKTEPCTEWYNGYTYADTLSEEAISKFIEITYLAYKDAVGEDFDGAVPAIFTDEPQFTKEIVLNFPEDKKLCKLPWTPNFPDTFLAQYGYDLIAHIPELFWDLPNDEVSQIRYFYHDHLCERFTNSFSALCGKWCDENGIKLTGHMVQEPSLMSQTASIGEAMRAYKHFGYPGIDMLCDKIELTTAKQAQSVVHQYGKEAMLSELYGVTNWDFDFRGHKFQGDWQAALGVTIRVPHLSWVSMRGEAKRDYPASINYQSPWFKEYSYVEDHFARVNTALTRGTPHVKIGVIHPIESYWLHWGPGRTTLDKRNQLDNNFLEFIKWMLYGQLDFDYISESLFPEECEVATSPIRVGKMEYTTLIVPNMETMRSTTLERLIDFRRAGGRLIFVGECPTHVDAKRSDAVRALYESSVVIPNERHALLDALEDVREIEIRVADGSLAANYIYQMRCDGDSRWLFIANAIRPTLCDKTTSTKIFVKISGEYTPTLYDTTNGKTQKIPYNCKDNFTYIEFDAYIHDSFLIKLDKTNEKALTKETTIKKKVIKEIDYRNTVKYKLDEPNVLLLDMAEFNLDDGKKFYPAEEILRLDKRVRELAGIPPKSRKQPWTLPEEAISHSVTLKFKIVSETSVEGALFAIEAPELCQIKYDGKLISNKPTGYFTDESIGTLPLPKITEGVHTITVRMPLGSRTYTEWCYLLGDFSVKVRGCEKTLYAREKKIGFGSVVPQGLPFYSGNVRYTCEFETEEDGCDAIFHAHNYRGALISLKVDGKEAGKIVYSPYSIEVKNLKAGKHKAEFTLFGNRYNCFAALHDSTPGRWWYGPDIWRSEGDNFCYEYKTKDFGILASPKITILK